MGNKQSPGFRMSSSPLHSLTKSFPFCLLIPFGLGGFYSIIGLFTTTEGLEWQRWEESLLEEGKFAEL